MHRVLHEELVADPEAEIRRLLDYCGLGFEESCLNFHQTDAPCAPRAPSRCAARFFTEGVEHWRNYEKWLEPLKTSLGSVWEAYPAMPES